MGIDLLSDISDMFVPIFRYYKEMEKFTRDHPDLIINVQFEDMKQVFCTRANHQYIH